MKTSLCPLPAEIIFMSRRLSNWAARYRQKGRLVAL